MRPRDTRVLDVASYASARQYTMECLALGLAINTTFMLRLSDRDWQTGLELLPIVEEALAEVNAAGCARGARPHRSTCYAELPLEDAQPTVTKRIGCETAPAFISTKGAAVSDEEKARVLRRNPVALGWTPRAPRMVVNKTLLLPCGKV